MPIWQSCSLDTLLTWRQLSLAPSVGHIICSMPLFGKARTIRRFAKFSMPHQGPNRETQIGLNRELGSSGSPADHVRLALRETVVGSTPARKKSVGLCLWRYSGDRSCSGPQGVRACAALGSSVLLRRLWPISLHVDEGSISRADIRVYRSLSSWTGDLGL